MTIHVNALVFPCGSEIGLELHRALTHSAHVSLVGGSTVSDHGRFVYEQYTEGIPFPDDPQFATALNGIIDRFGIELILPAHDAVVTAVADLVAAGTLAAAAVIPPPETCRTARSKVLTYARLSGVVPVPQVYDPADIVHFPVFVKPDVGQGSKGARAVLRPSELASLLEERPDLLVLELLPGPEYTVDCFTDRHGALRYIGARSRNRTSNGISLSSTFVDDPRLESMATAINSALPWRGGWFFQAKERADGELVLLEIAARIAGTSGVSRARGVNLPLLSVYDALDLDVTVAPNGYAVTVDRALENRFHLTLDYDHVYIDLDDLLLHADGRVDPEVVAFCVECHNRGKAVHLLTRHRGDLDATLARHRIAGLFTSVTWIRDDRPKSAHISSPRSILIDDSFAERDAVRRDLSIAVFDGSMVEALRHDLRGSQS